jgi:hypothetical protein
LFFRGKSPHLYQTLCGVGNAILAYFRKKSRHFGVIGMRREVALAERFGVGVLAEREGDIRAV